MSDELDKLRVGDEVTYWGKTCRVVATSGLDNTCIVRWTVNEEERISGWIAQTKVKKVTK